MLTWNLSIWVVTKINELQSPSIPIHSLDQESDKLFNPHDRQDKCFSRDVAIQTHGGVKLVIQNGLPLLISCPNQDLELGCSPDQDDKRC